MDISLINAGMAAGAGLAALPVILHLFMRPTPKQIIFPALRLIRERQKRSKKRLKVKNWLLLIARMLLLALMALALARPSIMAEKMIGDKEVPTAIGLVFDTSLSMAYTQQDKTRLDEAKEQAYDVLKKTPSSSVVYVVDSAEPTLPAPLSPDAARKRIEALSLRAANRTLNAAVGQVYTALADADKPRHEVYVLTDLARSAWDVDRPAEGLDKAEKVKSGVKTYILRLTPENVRDVSVVEAKPASDAVTEGEPVEIHAKFRSVGPAATRVAELWIDGEPRDKKSIEIAADGELEVRFSVPKINASTPIHQGEVRLTGTSDPLVFDDIRYFTFSVKPAVNVMIVSDLEIDGEFISKAVDPTSPIPGQSTVRPFQAEWVSTSKFLDKSTNLSKRFRVVYLNNVRSLNDAEWQRLSGFVQDGGGLVIGLGGRCNPESYQSATAVQLLPATVEKQVGDPKKPTNFGLIADFTHPLFNRFARELNDALTPVPVYKYWAVTPHEGSRTLLDYADKSPALLERVFKGARSGRVLLWTTPLSRMPEVAANSTSASWNELPILNWSGWYLMRQSATYLAGTAEENLTFDAGRDVLLPLDPTRRVKAYVVQDPAKKTSDLLKPPANSDSLVVVSPQQLGNWTVKGQGNAGNEETFGFSINPPEAESQFVPLDKKNLDSLFGGDKKYTLIRNPSDREIIVGIEHIGQELFPWIMALILLIVCLEGVLANRFYRESGTRAATPQPA